jgi:hypothetical protein
MPVHFVLKSVRSHQLELAGMNAYSTYRSVRERDKIG